MRVKLFLWLLLGISFLSLSGCDSAKESETKYLAKAQAYFAEKNYDKMSVELKNVLQINPNNVEAHYLSALVAEKNQDFRKMFANLSAVVDTKPDHFDAQLKLGKLFLFSKNKEKSLEKVEMVLQAQPDNADALALKAAIHFSKNEKKEAMALFDKVLQIQPGHYDASLMKIKMLGDEEKLAEAKQTLEAALAVHPEKLKLSLIKINILLVEGKKKEAEALYLGMIKRFSDNEMLYYNLAKLYTVDKKIDQAEKVLKDLIKQKPNEDQPKFVLIQFLLQQRGVELAEKELDSLIKENPDDFGFRLAKISLYKDDLAKVQQILEEIVEDDKEGKAGIDARNKLSKLYYSQDKKELAKKLVEEVIALDSNNVQALLLRAGLLIKMGDFDAAIADTRTVLRNEPESEQGLMLLGAAQLKSNQVELAEATLEKVLLLNPKNIFATKDIVRIKVSHKDAEGAIKLLVKAKTLFKFDRELSVMMIDLYGKTQEWEKAEKIAKELAEDPETKELSHFTLSQLYMGQQKYKKSIAELEILLTSNPKSPNVLAGLVNNHLALKDDSKAEKILEKVLADDKENPVFLTMRAELYAKKKQFSQAEQLFEKVIKIKPKVELGYKNLASLYLVQKQLNKVIDVYQQGLLILPDSATFMMQLGILNTVIGQTDRAIEAYEKLLLKIPGNLIALNNLASLLVEKLDQDSKQKAYDLIPPLKKTKYVAFLDTYGWVSYRYGKVDEALEVLEAVMQKEGVIPEMHYHLGMVYIDKGRHEEAILELEKAVVEGARYKELDIAKAELEKLKMK